MKFQPFEEDFLRRYYNFSEAHLPPNTECGVCRQGCHRRGLGQVPEGRHGREDRQEDGTVQSSALRPPHSVRQRVFHMENVWHPFSRRQEQYEGCLQRRLWSEQQLIQFFLILNYLNLGGPLTYYDDSTGLTTLIGEMPLLAADNSSICPNVVVCLFLSLS